MNKHKDHILDIHINPNVKELKLSATVAINDLSNELKRSGRDIFKLGLGQWRLGEIGDGPQQILEYKRFNSFYRLE